MLSTSLYSCNFLRERRIEIKVLLISSTVYFAPEELDFVSVRLKSFSVCPVKFVYRSRAISTAENLLSPAVRFRHAYLWSLEDWYCCVRNRLLHTLVLVLVLCTLLFLSCKRNKKVRAAGLFRRSRLPAQSLYTWSRNSPRVGIAPPDCTCIYVLGIDTFYLVNCMRETCYNCVFSIAFVEEPVSVRQLYWYRDIFRREASLFSHEREVILLLESE